MTCLLALVLPVLAPVELRLSLTELPESWPRTGPWRLLEGELEAVAGGLRARGERVTALLDAPPILASGVFEVTVEPGERIGQSDWAVAALALYESPERFWQFALVEDPDRTTRRIELVENLDSVWQAQNQVASRLELVSEGSGTWRPGLVYRLRLEFDEGGITGRARPLDAAEWQWTGRYAWPAAVPAVRAGRPALRTDSRTAVFRDLSISGAPRPGPAAGRQAALIGDGGPWADEAWSRDSAALRALLDEAGYQVLPAGSADLPGILDGNQVSLVAAPSLHSLPEPVLVAVASFIERGGDLLASGDEPFAQPLRRGRDGAWKPRAEALIDEVQPRWVIAPARVVAPGRASDRPELPPILRAGVTGPTGEPDALGVTLPDLRGWDTLAMPAFAESPFRPGESLTVVSVRGTPGQILSLEWKERDGTRWIATVPLADLWRTHVLAPSEFKYWPDGAAPGRASTTFRPADAAQFTFGAAMSHGTKPGRVEYAIGPVGVAANPWPEPPFEPPVIETISPWYKQYETRRGGRTVRVPIARARGLTQAAEPEGRFTAIGALTRPAATRYVADSGARIYWLPSAELTGAPRQTLLRLLADSAAGAALLNAGPAHATLLVGEPLELGGRAVSDAREASSARLRFTVAPAAGREEVLTELFSIPPGGIGTGFATAPALPAGEYRVTTRLEVGERVVDVVESPLRVVDPAGPRADGRRVAVADGRFVARGRRVFLNGTNYWPRYITGSELNRFWSHWLTPRNYDPELVEADLAVMEELGLNLVSVQYTSPDMARPMIDFVARCRAHGIWVNIFTGAANSFDPERDARLLRAALLDANDAVFAHDLLWEPRLGNQAERRSRDTAWRAWIDEQYGDLAAAERIWGTAAPRDDAGAVTNPPDALLESDGPHRVFVAAYRRFADDHISRHYGRVIRHLELVDAEVLMGVRTGYGGTGQAYPNRVMAYDLLSGAAHLDFTSPEGYGLPPDWERGRGTGFITAYGRWAGAGKPVFWSEFGQSIGPRGGSDESRELQRAIWDTMYRVIADSDADAAAGWWWPGGWRLGEESDYGVLHPDGTPRASLLAAAEWGRRLEAPQEMGDPVRIAIDRDADSRGTHGLWQRHGEAYVAAREAGRPVELVTAGTGTTTGTMPRVQVGGVAYAGVGPLAHANAEIGWIRSGDARLDNGATVAARAELRIELINTGEATWLPAAAGEGGCTLVLGDQRLALTEPVPRYGRTTIGPVSLPPGDVSGRLEAAGVGAFGEALRLTVTAR